MKVNQLEDGSWYLYGCEPLFISSYCKYIGEELDAETFRYIFHFLDGYVFRYSVDIVELNISPCSSHLSKYLDLFRLEEPNEEVP